MLKPAALKLPMFVCALGAWMFGAATARANPHGEVRPIVDDSMWYVRLGSASVAASPLRTAPMVTLVGLRSESDTFAIDVSALTISGTRVTADGNVSAATLLRLEGLRLIGPESERSAYAGAGLSYGAESVGRGGVGTIKYGNGWQADLTAGIETGRFSNVRAFLQADIGLPFYTLTRTSGGAAAVTDERGLYAPSFSISLGVGWRRGGQRGP